jgi:hypothetical protein
MLGKFQIARQDLDRSRSACAHDGRGLIPVAQYILCGAYPYRLCAERLGFALINIALPRLCLMMVVTLPPLIAHLMARFW